MIAGAGGIPEKIAPKTFKDQRADNAKANSNMRARKCASQSGRDAQQLPKHTGKVIPWPKEIKKPKTDHRPMGDQLEGKDAEELSGRFLNMIREAERLAQFVTDFSKLTHYRTLAQAAKSLLHYKPKSRLNCRDPRQLNQKADDAP